MFNEKEIKLILIRDIEEFINESKEDFIKSLFFVTLCKTMRKRLKLKISFFIIHHARELHQVLIYEDLNLYNVINNVH